MEIKINGNPDALDHGLSDKAFFGTKIQIYDTDLVNAERFARDHQADVRFTPERGWMIYDGRRWAPDQSGEIMRRAKDTARRIFQEITDAKKPGDETAIFKWARTSQGVERLKATLYLAQSEPGLPAHLSDFDSDPYLLNCLNGTLNLKTGQLHPHDRAQNITRLVPIEYDANADFKLWDKFLLRVMGGNVKMVDYLQRAFGFSLTGSTIEQCLFFLKGMGANGKSVLLEILKYLAGEYGLNTSTETLTLRQGGIRNDIARLAGARVVTVNETAEGQRLNEPLIKDMTGGDHITARFLHREFFDFKPQFKLWIRGNHKPRITGTDDGVWRRVHLIPFDVQIPEAERDLDLLDKLKAEAPGILSWAVRGCLIWQKHGLQPPERVKAATCEYRAEMDMLGAFLDECCDVRDGFNISAKHLYMIYVRWSEQGGQQAQSKMRFGLALTERGFTKKRTEYGYVYHGLGVLTEHLNTSEPLLDISPYARAWEGEISKGVHGCAGIHENDDNTAYQDSRLIPRTEAKNAT